MPAISVVITTYNRAQLLPRAIQSAQAAGSELEIIVVDDSSTDDTPHVCASISNIHTVRLSVTAVLLMLATPEPRTVPPTSSRFWTMTTCVCPVHWTNSCAHSTRTRRRVLLRQALIRLVRNSLTTAMPGRNDGSFGCDLKRGPASSKTAVSNSLRAACSTKRLS